MDLPLQNFGTLVKTQAAAVSSSCKQLIDMTVGSVLRAILEANASVGLWIQWLILQVLATTRAATSNGADLDSWVADFGMARLAAAPAAGQVQFARATPGLAASIPVGALVRTGTDVTDQAFSVTADATNPAWNGAGYSIAGSATSISVPGIAIVAGSAGNVRAGAIVQLATAIVGIDTVSNQDPFTAGLDAESDDALRQRFSGFLDSRTRATAQAVGFAITSVRQGLSYTISERVDSSGATRPGHFTVTLDDGTGAPSGALISQVAAAINAVRPIGGTFSIRPPLLQPVDIVIHMVANAVAASAAQGAVASYVTDLAIGSPLILSRLFQITHDSDPGIISISGVTINGAASDFPTSMFGLIRPNSVSVTS